MSVQSTYTKMQRASVKDILVAKAVQNGYNPYCRSTDADARKVTDEMRAKAMKIRVPETAALTVASAKKPPVREVKPTHYHREAVARREVVSIENFELVNKKAPAFSLGVLVSVCICAMMLTLVVYSGSLINEETRRYSDLTQTLENLQAEGKALTLALEEKNDLAVIEDIAKNDLGMIKVAEAEQKYVSLSGEDSIRTYEKESGEESFGASLLNAFGEKISGLLEYLD